MAFDPFASETKSGPFDPFADDSAPPIPSTKKQNTSLIGDIGTTGDDDLLFTFGRIRADQLGHLGSGLLKGHGATGGQLVRTTVHAGVNCTVEVRLGVDHRIRLLRGGRRIQVHERVPVNLLIQNRELRPNRLKINHYVPPTYVTIVRNEWESDMACSRP